MIFLRRLKFNVVLRIDIDPRPSYEERSMAFVLGAGNSLHVICVPSTLCFPRRLSQYIFFKIKFPLIYVFVQAPKLILKVVFLFRVICVRRTLLGIGCPKKLKVIFSLNVFVQATKCISIACCVCIVCVGPFPFWEGCLHFLLLIRWLLSRNEVDCNGSPEGKTAKTVPFLLCPPMTHL